MTRPAREPLDADTGQPLRRTVTVMDLLSPVAYG
jgi:hypothetical protein